MLRLPCPLLLAVGLLWGPLVGCGGGDTPPEVDAGPLPPDAGPPDAGPPDAGPLDRVPPIVTAHAPADGAVAVPPDRRIELVFSEPMQTQEGLLQLRPETAFPDNGRVKVRPQDWDAAGRQVSFAFPGGLPLETEVTVTASQFLDVAGNPLPTAFTFRFTVNDGQPPRVTATTPSEGASRVPLDTAQVSFTFNEPMDPLVGSLRTQGGLTLGPATWTSALVLTAPITSPLVNNGQYAVRLEGFRNVHGQAFSGGPTLGDGKLDFGTGPDLTPPTVVSASPAEGSLDVVSENTSRVVLTFSEPMKKTVGKAELVDGATRTVLTPQWTPDGFIVSYAVMFLRPNASLGIALSGFQDAVGNALDPKPYLGNGMLDFKTVPDHTRPYLESSTPVDGAQDVYPAEVYLTGGNPATGLRKRFTFFFSEPMNSSVTRVTLHESANPDLFRTFNGTWSADRRTLTVTITPVATGQLPLVGTREYYVNLTALQDAEGNPLETTFPGPGGDGRVEFFTQWDLPYLDHACAHALSANPVAVTATASYSGSTPRTDTLHSHYRVTLPGGNGSFTGSTRLRLGLDRLLYAFMSQNVPLEVSVPASGAVLEVLYEPAPPACDALTHMATFRVTANEDVRARFGPIPAQTFQFVLEED
ncbi:Ig-like domain-containing protein [Stigmatella erecta]|uniref:Ig-like domain-containing protein n=1 Tax=Stigmatella erecta TaxID=83460 RepID=A0A1I0JFM5_9BACT|nr:Ig-like domain-containing protein [Stigmatella erecta]SEU08963.1 Ig-like domain-containing protein [Stigmatella erecta]